MKADVVIIGAGIGGLTLALRLAQQGRTVVLAEKKDRPGGVVTSTKRDGFLLEKGPNSFSSGEEIMTLIDEVGLTRRAYTKPIREHDRFVWKNGELRKVPMGPMEFLSTDILTISDKWRIVRGIFGHFPPPDKDMELGAFFRQRIGDNAVDSLLKPFMAGVYASDADRISLEATLQPFFPHFKNHPSLRKALNAYREEKRSPNAPKKKKEPRCLVSFPEGLIELPETLAEKIQEAGGHVELGATISLSKGEGQSWTVALGSGREPIETTQVVITSAAGETASLLEPTQPETARWLRSIEYAGLTVVHIGVKEKHLGESRNGFGFLSVSGHGIRALGMIWSSSIFPDRAPRGHRLLTCFYGGEIDPDANALNDDEIRQQAIKDLKKAMKFNGGEFALFEIERWERALPIFRVDHCRRMENILGGEGVYPGDPKGSSGISLMANYIGRVSMPDRVKRAECLARRLHEVGKSS